MAQLKIRDLYELLRQAPRRRDLEQDGIRLVYDGTAVDMSTADAPDTVIARADTCGFTTEPWEVTAYRTGITSTEVWLRILISDHGDHLIDVCPFWASAPAAITSTAGGHTAAYPVIACPTAPEDRRP
ncbi:hypothetical protein [Streptomyces acidicola]|uniref:hypothetical protein n=1 Tax=Streptomyces acidicola TaxID=2596892 RepID=UPI0038252E7B